MRMKLPRRRSLKTRITLFTLLIFLCSIWSLEFFVSNRLRSDIYRLLTRQQFATASFMAADANRELERVLDALGRTASQMSPALLANKATVKHFFEDQELLAFRRLRESHL